MPKVSVIVPVYNTEKYLRKCLDSIVGQTLENIEILCIDDCSTDSSLNILQEYAQKDSRVKVFRNSKNKGLSATRNVGIDNACGEYIQFVDSDDWIEPDMEEVLYQTATGNRLDLLKCLSSRQVEASFDESVANRVFLSGEELLEKLLSQRYCGVSACLLFLERRFMEKCHLRFDPKLRFAEDTLFSFQAIMIAQRCMCVNERKYQYIRRQNSLSTGSLSDAKIYSLLYLLKKLMDFSLTDCMDRKYRQIALAFLIEWYEQEVSFIDKRLELPDMSQWDPEIQKIYRIFFSGKGFVGNYIDREKLGLNSEAIHRAARIYVFGAGDAAQRLIQILYRAGIEIDGVVVTDPAKNRKTVYGYPVFSADAVGTKDGQPLILCAVKGVHDEIDTLLKRHGLHNVLHVCP